MVEKMARAMVANAGGDPDAAVHGSAGVSAAGFVYTAVYRRAWEDKIADARAALTAMLEPTEAMVLAAVFCDNRTSNGDTLSSDQIREEFKDAIQAALDEK